MSREKTVDADKFAAALEDILDDVLIAGYDCALEGVRGGIREGGKLWRKHAKQKIGEHEYVRHGETITSGKYAKSIRSHMLSTDEMHPEGEVGSKKLAGLTHLLQNGHARVGGGRVAPVLDLDTEVVPGAFNAAMEAAAKALEDGLK